MRTKHLINDTWIGLQNDINAFLKELKPAQFYSLAYNNVPTRNIQTRFAEKGLLSHHETLVQQFGYQYYAFIEYYDLDEMVVVSVDPTKPTNNLAS